MIAFAVSVNGQHVCTIGIGDHAVLGAHVSWVGEPGEPGELNLGLGGLDRNTEEHVRWPDPPEIRVGDTITIKVIETEMVDAPIERRTPEQLVEDEKAFLAEVEESRRTRPADGQAPDA